MRQHHHHIFHEYQRPTGERPKDYLELKKRLHVGNLQKRSDLIVRQRHLEESFEPIVASNQKMAKDVINDLIPIKEELK